jgi:diketogulonate reductase-like aldo/keto reductase
MSRLTGSHCIAPTLTCRQSPSNYTDVLASGGRGLDTALTYGKSTQLDVAAAVRAAVAGGIKRSDIFVTTKVSG